MTNIPKVNIKPAAIAFKPQETMMAASIPIAKPKMPAAIRLPKERIPNPKPIPGFQKYRGIHE